MRSSEAVALKPRGLKPRGLRAQVARHQVPSTGLALWQIASSFVPLLALCAAMYALVDYSIPAVLLLAIPAAGFVVRIFIIQHDCGHGSFFAARWANDLTGTLCSLVTLTPYLNWRRQHAGHHANWNNLDRRESGADIYSTCLTVEEYRALPARQRFFHRVICHPLVRLVLLPPVVFLLLFRVPFDTPKDWGRERLGVHLTNLGILAIMLALGFGMGWRALLLVQLPISIIASTIGVWLFSVQHRFERTFWARQDDWTHTDASLAGSSYLKLPRVLQWFTGNIGFHHIHHLNSRIPNYRLAECHHSVSGCEAVPVMTLGVALASYRYALWDEEAGRMVRFASLSTP